MTDTKVKEQTFGHLLKLKGMKVITIEFFETTYDYFLRTVFGIANPIKKSIIKTQCKVHKFINIQALKILRNDGYAEEYNFFSSYILDINKGAVWADQDFKSSNHFYNPYKKKGLYGRRSAMELGVDYYFQAIGLWREGAFNESLFYLGAALHIIQDMTIPQHANIRLLDSHRQYETFVKRTYQYIDDFKVERGTYLLDSVEDYIRFNARIALKIHKRFKKIVDEEHRYYRLTKCGLPLAKKTTAGAMIMFYKDVFSKNQ
ncbi:phospholipase C zinc-binding protein [Alkaliphilus metalliredigens QYMF]|uniref:Phospholipase C n=1 Tax=Alkaliphilus metalliredigens (strain QYMF) TaxID=293826 RepID=A6TKQ8_ALKMQ|nr:zinc dependent phospholipase C family protein [Alkaliphilus metalliredigens]ABR46776.1 phospholipase C zinc-binding protein [Alkaliphilus metalliredigens QYMF]